MTAWRTTMSMLTHWTDGITADPRSVAAGGIGTRLRVSLVWLWQAWGHYRAARAMQALSPEMLKDIGVSFAEIDCVVREGRRSLRRGARASGGCS